MGEIVGAGLLSHVPTIMLPEDVRMDIYKGKDTSIIEGFHRLRSEVLDDLKPDTFIVFDTHWGTLFDLIVTAHDKREGHYTSEELPRGLNNVPYDLKGNPELANLIAEEVTDAGVVCTPIDDDNLPIHYPTVNTATYLDKGEAWISIGMLMSGEADDFMNAGRGIAKAIERSNSRVALIASGSMSHTFYPYKQLRNTEPADPELIFSAGAREADYERLDWFKNGNHAKVIDTMDEYYRFKPEGRFGHYLMMASALGGRDCTAKGRMFSEYENSVGTSQVHVWFDRPEGGWTA